MQGFRGIFSDRIAKKEVAARPLTESPAKNHLCDLRAADKQYPDVSSAAAAATALSRGRQPNGTYFLDYSRLLHCGMKVALGY